MRLLADENFPKALVEFLRTEGHDVIWARTDLPGASDSSLLDLAEKEARIVLTLDKDFWQVGVQRRVPMVQSGIVLFRVHPATPANLERFVRALLEAEADWTSHVSIISAGGVQMARVPRL